MQAILTGKRGRYSDMTDARKKTIALQQMQRRSVSKAMHAAKYGKQVRESAKIIGVKPDSATADTVRLNGRKPDDGKNQRRVV